jgi:hypothetical protein
MTKKVIAIEVSDVSRSFVITRLRLNLLFACPNLPSIVLRNLSSSYYISITPGFWAIINPENDSSNATQWVGHIRTSFNF